MKAYSKDLRIRVLDAVDGGTPRPEVIRLFGVSATTIVRWRRRRRETGSLAVSARPGPPGPKRAGLRAGLLPQLAAHPDATLEQHCTWWEQAHGVRVSHATMSRVIARDFGWTRKKTRTANLTWARGFARAGLGRRARYGPSCALYEISDAQFAAG